VLSQLPESLISADSELVLANALLGFGLLSQLQASVSGARIPAPRGAAACAGRTVARPARSRADGIDTGFAWFLNGAGEYAVSPCCIVGAQMGHTKLQLSKQSSVVTSTHIGPVMVLIVMHGKRVVAQSCNTPHEPEDDRGADGREYNGNRDACALLSELGRIAVECAVDVHAESSGCPRRTQRGLSRPCRRRRATRSEGRRQEVAEGRRREVVDAPSPRALCSRQ